MKHFFLTLLFLSIALGAGAALIPATTPSFAWVSLALLSGSTGALFVFLYKTSVNNLVPYFLLTMVLKLIIFGIYCVVMIVIDRQGANANVVFFMISYALLTTTETAFIYLKTRV